MTKIVTIGAGRLAHHLMPRLELAGCEVVQAYNRTEERAAALVRHLKTAVLATTLEDIRTDADLYFITVADDFIPVIARQLAEQKNISGTVVHCSGILGLEVLPFSRRGVFYPLQTFSAQHAVPWATTPVLITADDPDVKARLQSIAAKITEAVHEVTDHQKGVLHVAAVFANNFTNHMLTLSERICEEEQLSFEILKPLIRETIEKAIDMGPAQSQTGPAIRGDKHTLDKHLAFLESRPELYALYKAISESIRKNNL